MSFSTGFVPVLDNLESHGICDNFDSRPGKSWNFCPGHRKSWNLMLANIYAAELPTVLDCPKCMRETTLNYGKM